MNELSKERMMTVKEVAKVFDCSSEAVRSATKKHFPDLMRNGITTYLNEIQVTIIKKELEKHHNLQTTQELPKTQLEKAILIKQAMLFQEELVNILQQELIEKENRINRLIHNKKLYTTTEISKELGLKSPQDLNQELYNNDIQYKVNKTWVLKARYSEKGYVSIKQIELDSGQIIYDRKWTGLGRDFILDLFNKDSK